MKTHELRLNEKFWDDVVSGLKTAEICFNDRDYQVGDQLKLYCVDDNGLLLTLPPIIKQVTNVVEGGQYGIESGYCLLSMVTPSVFLESVSVGYFKEVNQDEAVKTKKLSFEVNLKELEHSEGVKPHRSLYLKMPSLGQYKADKLRDELMQAGESIGCVFNHTEDEHAIHFASMANGKIEKALEILKLV